MVFSSLSAFSSNLTLKIWGISLLPGNLYVDGPVVSNFPSLEKHNSSHVNHPKPWIKPPSIWPISIFSLREKRISTTLCGVSRPESIEKNLAWAKIEIPSDFWNELSKLPYSNEDPEANRVYKPS